MVEWLDAHAGRGWLTEAEIRAAAEPLYCRSVGWLVAETEDCLVVVPHLSGERGGEPMLKGSGDLTIPKQAIVRSRVIGGEDCIADVSENGRLVSVDELAATQRLESDGVADAHRQIFDVDALCGQRIEECRQSLLTAIAQGEGEK